MHDDSLIRCDCGNDVRHDEGVFPRGRAENCRWSVRCGNPDCSKEVDGACKLEAIANWNNRHNT